MTDQVMNPYNPGRPVQPKHFAGRKEQIKVIRGWLANVRGGDAARLFVKGDWGVGKTSLLRKLEPEFREYGVVVREDVPDGSTTQAQATAFYRALIEDLVNETGSEFEPDFEFSFSDPRAVRKQLTKLIKELWNTKAMVVIVVLDEMQRATPEFLSNVKDVFQRVDEDAPYFMLVFAGTSLPGAGEQASDPIARAFETVPLGPMDREESLEAIFKPIKVVPGFEIEDSAADLIQSRAAGHPYFLKQICSQVFLSANGKGRIDRIWLENHWSEVEANLERNRFGDELTKLPGSESETLLQGSLHGPEFSRSAITGLKASALDTALSRLKKSGLLCYVSRGIVRFYHPLFHSYVRAKAIEAGTPIEHQPGGSLEELIAQGEGAHVEFKESLEADNKTGEKHPSLVMSVLKTIVAFQNTDGGTLLIGVADDGTVRGLEPDMKLMGNKKKRTRDGFTLKLNDLVRKRLMPEKLHRASVHWAEKDGKDVCIVAVPRFDGETYLENCLYVRNGPSSIKIEPGPDTQSYIEDRQERR